MELILQTFKTVLDIITPPFCSVISIKELIFDTKLANFTNYL